MSAYNNVPGVSVPSLAPGNIGYSFGSQNTQSPPLIKTIAASPGGAVRTSNTVTITTTAAHGFKVGEYVTIVVTTVVGATSFDGTFVIASVPSTTTFTYAQTAANDTGGGGTATYPSNIITQVPAAVNTSGQQFAIAAQTPPQGRTVTWGHTYTVAPDAVTIVLQGAAQDVEASYVTLDSDNTAAGLTKTVTGIQHRFLRLKCTALTLGSGAGQTGFILV